MVLKWVLVKHFVRHSNFYSETVASSSGFFLTYLIFKMKKLFTIGLICFLTACKDRSVAKDERADGIKKTDVFPITSFLAGQIHEVDSLAQPIVKYTTNDGVTDSATISKEEFKRLANEFMKPDITEPANKKLYKETSFADQSVPSVTITYSTTLKNLEVRRIDVIIKPDPVISDKVQSIYMEKLSQNKDTSVLKKLLWKTDQNFQIITSTQAGNNPPVFNQLKVSWSHRD